MLQEVALPNMSGNKYLYINYLCDLSVQSFLFEITKEFKLMLISE